MEYSRKSILQSFVRSYLQSVLTWSHNLASHEQIENKIAEQVKNNIYVDNLITGDSNGMEVYNTAEELFRQSTRMGYEQYRTLGIPAKDDADTEAMKVIGICWNC